MKIMQLSDLEEFAYFECEGRLYRKTKNLVWDRACEAVDMKTGVATRLPFGTVVRKALAYKRTAEGGFKCFGDLPDGTLFDAGLTTTARNYHFIKERPDYDDMTGLNAFDIDTCKYVHFDDDISVMEGE